MIPIGHGVIKDCCDLLYNLKGKVNFVVGLTLFMTPKIHGIITGHHDLLFDLKGHCDLCSRFHRVYDSKWSWGH